MPVVNNSTDIYTKPMAEESQLNERAATNTHIDIKAEPNTSVNEQKADELESNYKQTAIIALGDSSSKDEWTGTLSVQQKATAAHAPNRHSTSTLAHSTCHRSRLPHTRLKHSASTTTCRTPSLLPSKTLPRRTSRPLLSAAAKQHAKLSRLTRSSRKPSPKRHTWPQLPVP